MEYEQLILAATENWAHYGYLGLLAGSFLSALFIPLGADILYVARLGGLVIYTIGYAGNTQRIKKLFRIKESQLIKQKTRVEKYGSLLALFVWIPVIGDISNVALGFYRTSRTRTFILMFIGRMTRFLLWTILFLIYANHFVQFIDKF